MIQTIFVFIRALLLTKYFTLQKLFQLKTPFRLLSLIHFIILLTRVIFVNTQNALFNQMTYSTFIKYTLLIIVISSCGKYESGQVKVTGLEDLDFIRKEVLLTPTDQTNARSRKAALYRFYRLLWRQGIQMESFDSIANILVDTPIQMPTTHNTIDNGYRILNEILSNTKYITEINGDPSQPAASQTNWAVYHGVDGSQSGYSPDAGPSMGSVAWRFPKSNGWAIQPMVVGNEVFLSGAGADVIGYKLNAKTGEVKWKARYMSPSYYNTPGSRYEPVVLENQIAFQIGAKYHAFDRNSGAYTSITSDEAVSIMSWSKNVSLIQLSENKPLWYFPVDDEYLTEKPSLASESVFISTTEGRVICLDKEDGSSKWQIKLPEELRGAISVSEKLLFVTSIDRTIFALNQSDGSIIWSKQIEPSENRAYEYFSDFEIISNRIYFGTAAGFLYCLDETTGEIIWNLEVGEWVRSKPLKKQNHIYLGTLEGRLLSIRENNNQPEVVWNQQVGDHGFNANLAASEFGLLATNENMLLYNINFSTGKIYWKHSLLDGIWKDDQFIAAEEQSGQQSSPTIADGILYIAGPDGFLNAVNVETGKELWKFEAKSSISPSPTVAEGKVFIGQTYRSFGKYFALDALTGEPVWTTDDLGSVWINAAYDNGRLFLGNMDGYFFAIDPSTGDKLWEYNTIANTAHANKPLDEKGGAHGWPPGVYCNPITEDGVVYTGSWSGYYFAFDQASGELLWRTKTQPEGSEGGLPDSAAPVLYKNHIYVQKAGFFIAAINKYTGIIDWEWAAPRGFLQNGTVAANGNRVFGSVVRKVTDLGYHAEIIAFNDVPNGGEKLWSYRGGGGLTAPVLTKDKLIFGSSADPFLTCLSPETGEIIWRLNVGGIMLESVPSIYGNKVFALIKNGYLYAVE